MILTIDFPDNLSTRMLLELSNIPCFCMVGREFEILFHPPLPEACGSVREWEMRRLQERAPAGGGGAYVYHQPGLITLRQRGGGEFDIIDLQFFSESVGWCPIIENGEYAPCGALWGDEVDWQ